jgi:SAM-dependent methyltransferase
MYIRERLRGRPPGRFVEVGVGSGALSSVLLGLDWQGVAYDISLDAVVAAQKLNSDHIARGRYEVRHEDWLEAEASTRVDLVISSMVIEHLSSDKEEQYFERCRSWLRRGGLAIVLVPASPAHWGIEDEIAGHIRRYTRQGISQRLRELSWTPRHVAGLTYPLSNVLLPVSNLLVSRAEAQNREFSQEERTRRSGVRKVPLKTHFPQVFALFLNRATLYPLHLLQKANRTNEKALVLYVECTPLERAVEHRVDHALAGAGHAPRQSI